MDVFTETSYPTCMGLSGPQGSRGARFEVYGHVIAELFNPGDYYDTDKPGYFIRWQLDFAF